MFLSRKFLDPVIVQGIGLASMGPGCFHPGNVRWDGSGRSSKRLQWGRDVSIPEMCRAFLVILKLFWLQWGRDVSIPEMTRADARDGVVDQLQWGRDVSIPEILVKASVPCVLVVLQWGRDVSIPEIRGWGRPPSAK